MPPTSDVLLNEAASPANFDDQHLAMWLGSCLGKKHRVAFVHAGYLCKVVDLDDPSLVLHLADPGPDAKTCLKKFVGPQRLFSLEVSFDVLSDAQVADSSWPYSVVPDKPTVVAADRKLTQ